MKGLVIKNTGSWYQVKTDDGSFLLCGLRTNQRYLFLILNDCIQVCYDESPFVYSGPGMRAHGPWYTGS
jgi:hypothetical protein